MANFLCRRLALALLLVAGPGFAGEPARSIADTLAMQDAVRQGRALLTKGEAAKAVELLEAQIGKIQGDPTYLALLKDAYRAHLRDLQLANKTESAAVIRDRLAKLEREGGKPVVAALPKPEVVRGVRPDDDPFAQVPTADIAGSGELLTKAAAAFTAERFSEAGEFYRRGQAAGRELSVEQKKQWAYCRLSAVVARANVDKATPSPEFEREIRAALALATGDEKITAFGTGLLRDLANRGLTPGHDGWSKLESPNFRILHRDQAELAAQMLKLAEGCRSAAFTKWAGAAPSDWQPTCEIYLHPQATDYANATGQPATAPGHSTIKAQSGKVIARRMDLRSDEPNLLGSVLPHEITHVVLGDVFADAPLPRWADEGMAVLAEPRSQIERYGRTLVSCRNRGQLIPLADILARPDYPEPAQITVFYVESVSVVEYLVGLKGPATFVLFLRESPRNFDAALSKHYGIRNVADLQTRWLTDLRDNKNQIK